MLKRSLAILVILGAFAYAKSGCILEQSGKLDVLWQAYKTPKKVGVKGTFDSVTYVPAHKSGKNFKALFVGSTIHIDTASVNSGNKIRDEKLVTFFFQHLTNGKINGKILSMKADPYIKGKPRTGKMVVTFRMNGHSIKTTLDYHYYKGSFKAQGNIDLLDFAAGKALATINKACFDLHQGKTWSDVSIGFVTTIKATLCHVDSKKR